jgi:lysozyme
MNIYDLLEFEEGYREKPYLCSEGYVTCGIGTKLHKDKGLNPEDFPIRFTRKIAEEFLKQELKAITIELQRSDVSITMSGLSTDRQHIILSMCYQMGVRGVLGFKKMWKALEVEDEAVAQVEMLDSKWARQTPERAERHADVIFCGSLDVVYGGLIC